jgi:hypothetical protein
MLELLFPAELHIAHHIQVAKTLKNKFDLEIHMEMIIKLSEKIKKVAY